MCSSFQPLLNPGLFLSWTSCCLYPPWCCKFFFFYLSYLSLDSVWYTVYSLDYVLDDPCLPPTLIAFFFSLVSDLWCAQTRGGFLGVSSVHSFGCLRHFTHLFLPHWSVCIHQMVILLEATPVCPPDKNHNTHLVSCMLCCPPPKERRAYLAVLLLSAS